MTLMYLLDSNQDVIEIVPKGLTLELWQEMGINEIDTLHGTMILNPKLKSKIDETFYVGVPDMVDKHSFNLYRLIKKEVTNTEINIQGIQLGFDELASKGYIKDMRPKNEPFQSILSRLLQDSGWGLGFVDDRLPIVNGSFYYMNRLEAIGELINLTGAELKFKVAISNNKITDKYVEAYLQMGSDSGKRFTYGSNSLDIVAEENVAELYTAILGRGRGEEVSSADDNASGQAGYGRKIDFAEIEWKKSSGNPVDKPKGQEYVEIPEATEMFGFTDGSPRLLIKDYPNIDDPAQLLQASYRDLLNYSRPKVQFKTRVENVGNLHVGDTVSIIRYDLDLKYQARVFKVKYNRLDLGASEIDLGDALMDSNAKSQAKFRKQVSREIREVDRAIENTYIIATNGTRVSFGADEPENKKVDDVWYETMPDGTVRLRIWNGNEWIIEVSDTFGKEVEEQVNEAVAEIEEVRESANKANEDINQAIQDAGFTSLSDTILNIQEISNNAQGNASTAIENAGKALEDAQSAISQLGDISLVADNALSNAESALSSASSAQTMADDLSKQVSDFSIDVEGFSQTVNDYEGQVSSLESTVSGLRSDIVNYEIELDEFGNEVGRYATEVATFSNTVNGLESTVGNYQTELRGYRGDVTQYQNQVSTMTNTVNGFNNTVAQYTTEVDEFGNEVNAYATQVSTLENTVDGFRSSVDKVEEDYQGLSGTVASHTSSISNLNGQIALKANTTTVNTLTGRVSSAESSIKVNADGIKLKANTTTVNALTGRVSTAESGITTNANAIKLKASQSSVDTLSGKVNTLGAQLDVTAGQISSKVWMSDIDDLEIGGRNLVLHSHFYNSARESGNSGWRALYGNFSFHDDTIMRYMNDGSHSAARFEYRPRMEVLEPDTWYVFTMRFRSDRGLDLKDLPYVIPEKETYLRSVGEYSVQSFRFKVTTTSEQAVLRFYQGNPLVAGGMTFIDWVKIEKGDKATDWTPAPEDSDNKIDHVETTLTQKHDAIEATVSSVRTDLTGTTTLLNTTRTTVNSHTSSISTLRTDVNGKATTAQFNTLNSTVNGTITRVGNAEGKITQIETNVSGLQTTVASKASQSQVTQLATGLSSVVSDLDNLEIGGRNLILRSHFYGGTRESGNSGWSANYGRFTFNNDTMMRYTNDGSHVATRFEYRPRMEVLEPDTWYVFTMRFQSDRGVEVRGLENVALEKATTLRSVGGYSTQSFRFKVTSNNQVVLRFYQNSPLAAGGWTQIDWAKLEKGNKSTDWTPAPEDMATNSQITQLSNNINLRVAKGDVVSQLNIDAGRTLISSNRIYLDSSSVVFSGNAFIPSAAITSLTASKINTGTLNANNVSITNLDVNDLVGNKATFIRASFQSVSSNLDITSKGIKVSAGSFNVWMDFNGIDIEDSTKGNARMGSLSGMVSSDTDEPNSVALFAEPNYAISLSANKSGNNYQQSLRVDGVNGTLRMWAVRHIGFGWNSRTGPNQYGSLTYRDGTGHLHLHADKELWLSSSANKIFLGARLDMDNRRIEAVNSMHLNGGGRIFTSASADSKTGHKATALYAEGTLSLGAGSKRHMRIYTYSSGNGGIDVFSPIDMSGWDVNNVNILTFNEGTNHGKNRMYGVGGTLSLQGSNRWEFGTRRGDALQMAGSHNGTTSHISAYGNINMQGNNLTNTSDLREKTNIEDSTFDALSSILNWRFVDFDWINSEYKPEGRQYGLIAQWTEDIVLYDEFEKVYSINSSKQMMMNSHAIQQLGQGQLKIKDLAKSNEDKIHELQMQLSKANDRIRELEGKS